MGNVSSADHDKVNELLTRRARKKIINKKLLLQQQQQQQQLQQPQQQQRISGGPANGVFNGSNVSQGQHMQRQKSSSKTQHLPHPLDQAEFYTGASFSPTKNIGDLPPHSPASPSFSIPSSATTPTSASYQSDFPYASSRYSDDRPVDTISAAASPTSPHPHAHFPQWHPPHSAPSLSQYHSSPIVISQQRHNHASTNGVDDTRLQQQQLQLARSPGAPPGYVPSRRGSEHHLQHLQQQQQLATDMHLLGTSPEAKDWLKQKPTRSSTHMIHQYNFHSHQYYQQPGSIAIKIVNNTCRNMGDYPNVPSLVPSQGTRSFGATVNQAPTSLSMSSLNSNNSGFQRSAASKSTSAIHSNPISVGGMLSDGNSNSNGGGRTYSSAPIPHSRSRGMSQPEAMSPTTQCGSRDEPSAGPSHGQHGQSVHLGAPPQNQPLQDPRMGKLVMSRSKLTSPLASTVISPTTTNSHSNNNNSSAHSVSPALGSPLGTPASNVASSEMDGHGLATPSGPRQHRPSSTLSSLRSLLGNHPQGLSLIESLEEDEDDDLESLSDTETGDSEADLIQRTQSMTTSDASSAADFTINTTLATLTLQQERRIRKRPPPQLEWMQARRRFSSSSLSTISREIQDSQKGQHALWKYIGGGNSHAPLRYDIDRILDSGCGLGEWTMEMAKEFPNATVYGIDINPELFPSAHQPVPSNCLFTQSNLLTRLSFPNKYFDFVYQRFLYLGLTVDDWPVALKELRRVMKPGGWIELFEPSMRVHRAGTRTREVMRWCSRLLQEERGLDFDFAGEKMKRLCESAEIGFENVKLERLSIPVGSWGGRVGQAMAENMVLIFQNLQSALIPDDTTQTPNGQAQRSFDMMVRSWIIECEENKSYIDYYILTGQRPLE